MLFYDYFYFALKPFKKWNEKPFQVGKRDVKHDESC